MKLYVRYRLWKDSLNSLPTASTSMEGDVKRVFLKLAVCFLQKTEDHFSTRLHCVSLDGEDGWLHQKTKNVNVLFQYMKVM